MIGRARTDAAHRHSRHIEPEHLLIALVQETGGMASTVELFDGYQFEIAGSVQLPTSSIVSNELGLDALPQSKTLQEALAVQLVDSGDSVAAITKFGFAC